MPVSRSLIFASLLLMPLQAAVAQTSGGAPGAAPSAGARPNPGVLGESINNSNPNPSLNTNPSAAPNVPGTNSAGTAQPSGSSVSGPSPNVGAGVTTGSAPGRAGGRVGGVDAQGPNKNGDPIQAEDANVDKKIKSICRGC